MENKMNTPEKHVIISLLRAWINQRPGLEYCNYGDPTAYRAEYRRIQRQKNDALELLHAVDRSNITADNLLAGFRAFSGRLQIVPDGDEFRLEYCTGQYFPTEYRAAACAVLASALWAYYREDIPADVENKGEALRAKFRRMFGRSIAGRWFN